METAERITVGDICALDPYEGPFNFKNVTFVDNALLERAKQKLRAIYEQPPTAPVESQAAGSVELLRELISASAPYLRRKKMTPRHECNELNRVWAKCVEYLEKHSAMDQPEPINKETER